MKISKFIFSIFILSLISSIVFTGCQQEEELDKSNRNEIYLSLPFNADFNKLTNEDREIIFQAFSRLDIKENEDGLFEILQNAGKDANISEELFKYFQLIAYNSNEKILSENYFSRNRIQTRTEIGNTRTDCVARSIAYATGQSFDEVNSWITKTYGSNGVPSDKFYFAMNHFCDDGGMIGLSMFQYRECKTSTPLFLFGNVTRVLFIILFNLIFCKMKKISKISLHQLDRAELSKKQ